MARARDDFPHPGVSHQSQGLPWIDAKGDTGYGMQSAALRCRKFDDKIFYPEEGFVENIFFVHVFVPRRNQDLYFTQRRNDATKGI